MQIDEYLCSWTPAMQEYTSRVRSTIDASGLMDVLDQRRVSGGRFCTPKAHLKVHIGALYEVQSTSLQLQCTQCGAAVACGGPTLSAYHRFR